MSKSALVVDDSKSARFALRKYLENHAYKVDAAESAEQCYEYLKSHRPEVIFLDHVMPGADGFDVLKHIKSDPNTVTIPVVICSSNEGEEFTKQARSRGAADVLQKPPSPDQLVRVLDTLAKLAAVLKPQPGKVTPIRPVEAGKSAEAAIEEGAMRAVREALPVEPPKVDIIKIEPPRVEPLRMDPPRPATPPASMPAAGHHVPSAPMPTPAPPAPAGAKPAAAPTDAAAMAQLRDHVETRLRKITSEMYVQLAELKAQVTNIDAGELARQAQDSFRGTLESELGALSRSLQEQIAALGRTLDEKIGPIRTQLDQVAQAQQRAHQTHDRDQEAVLRAARAGAAQEAQGVAEKVVMNAASNISRQLADAIIQAFGKH